MLECLTLAVLCADGELNVLEDILTEAPDHDDELYNPESERDVIDKKGTRYSLSRFRFEEIWKMMSAARVCRFTCLIDKKYGTFTESAV